MKKRAIVTLGVAVLLGSLSVQALRGWMENRMARTEPPEAPATTVVVARNAMGFGSRVLAENLMEVPWPKDSVPAGAFARITDVAGQNGERVVLRPLEANEPVLATKVSGFGGRATLSTVISGEMRAVTIRVNDVNGVAGFVLPGDHVDVLLTRDESQTKTDPYTDVLLQNIKVLGVDQEANERKDQPVLARAVTLEVSPEQAQKLTLGAQVGTLSLALRNYANGDPTQTRTVNLRDLKGGEIPPPPQEILPAAFKAPVRPAAHGPVQAQVRIWRGLSPHQYEVSREGREGRDGDR